MKLKVILSLFIITLIIFTVLIFLRSKNQEQFKNFSTTFIPSDKGKPGKLPSKPLKEILLEKLNRLEVPANRIKVQFREDSTMEIKATIPRGRPMEWIVWFLSESVEKSGYSLDDCYYENDEKGCKILFKSINKYDRDVSLVLTRSSSFFSQTAKMAIFIQDFGFQADQTTIEYLSFPEPLTVGLVPEKKLVTWTAQIANEYHKELVVLLAMEPLPSKYPKQSKNVIMVHYPEDKVKSILNEAMGAIPHSAGIANFFGARIVDDSRVMSLLYSEMQKKQIYFLYTPPVRTSSAEKLAHKFNVPFKSVDVTLDTSLNVATLQDTLRHSAMIAQKTGSVIISSKPGSNFITALKSELPVLKQNGIRLVYISDLIKDSKKQAN